MKDIDELVKLFVVNGFTLARMRNHQIWNCPCGHTRVTFSSTPSKGNRSYKNTEAQMKRTLRQCRFEEGQ